MLKWLLEAQDGRTAEGLLVYWHNLMENSERIERNKFFEEVVNLANSVSHLRSQFNLEAKVKRPPL